MASIKLKGDTSGEVIISAPSVAGNTTLTLPATSSTLATQNALGVRNLIINGDMRIAQRGTSATNVNIGYFTMDRWRSGANFGSFDFAQSTDVPSGQGFANSFKADCNTSATPTGSNEVYIDQKIEGQNLQHFKFGTSSAESITISFWVKSNKTGTYSVWLFQPDASRDAALPYTINSANTWEKKTLTFNGDTSGTINNDNGSGFEVRFYLGTGPDLQGTCDGVWNGTFTERYPSGGVNIMDSTSNEWLITGVQLEVGTATPFEHRPYDMELARCQRYFSTSYGNNPVGTNTWDGTVAGRNYDTSSRNENVVNIHFPVQMRASPTLTAYSKAGTSGKLVAGSITIDASTTEITCSLRGSPTIIRAVTGAAVGGTHWYQFHYTANAEL